MAKKSVVPSSNKIVNINSVKKKGNIQLQADKGYYQLKYYKNHESFFDIRDYVRYVKAIERIVRSSKEYKAYVGYLNNEIGLDYCAVMPSVSKEKDGNMVEMHHGPILNLFDVCCIVLDALLNRKEKVSTFRVAKLVMQEHYENNIQVVMLSKTAHQLTHAGKLYIHPSQAWGNISEFLGKYKDGLTQEQIQDINEHIEQAENQPRSTDNGYLKTNEIKNWSKQKDIELMDEDEDEEE